MLIIRPEAKMDNPKHLPGPGAGFMNRVLGQVGTLRIRELIGARSERFHFLIRRKARPIEKSTALAVHFSMGGRVIKDAASPVPIKPQTSEVFAV